MLTVCDVYCLITVHCSHVITLHFT